MNCLIIGYGSIGARHAAILTRMGHEVSFVSAFRAGEYICHKSAEDAFACARFDYVVVSNKTCDHFNTLQDLIKLDYRGLILIEKPLFDRLNTIPPYDYSKVFVASNLRFHPVIQEIAALVQDRKIYSVDVYVGQYLPDWRPGRDYRTCYSASRAAGGGVLRDLIHEVDYINWITGGWKSVSALGGRFSDLEIDSDDVFCMLIESEKCPAIVLQMNYLDRRLRREIIINAQDLSVKGDLAGNTLEINGKLRQYDVSRDKTYHDQHVAILHGETSVVCSLEQGIEALRLIEEAEMAAKEKVWKIK